MFVEGAKNGNYRSVSIAHSLRGALFLGGAAPAIAGAGFNFITFLLKSYVEPDWKKLTFAVLESGVSWHNGGPIMDPS